MWAGFMMILGFDVKVMQRIAKDELIASINRER